MATVGIYCAHSAFVAHEEAAAYSHAPDCGPVAHGYCYTEWLGTVTRKYWEYESRGPDKPMLLVAGGPGREAKMTMVSDDSTVHEGDTVTVAVYAGSPIGIVTSAGLIASDNWPAYREQADSVWAIALAAWAICAGTVAVMKRRRLSRLPAALTLVYAALFLGSSIAVLVWIYTLNWRDTALVSVLAATGGAALAAYGLRKGSRRRIA